MQSMQRKGEKLLHSQHYCVFEAITTGFMFDPAILDKTTLRSGPGLVAFSPSCRHFTASHPHGTLAACARMCGLKTLSIFGSTGTRWTGTATTHRTVFSSEHYGHQSENPHHQPLRSLLHPRTFLLSVGQWTPHLCAQCLLPDTFGLPLK